MRGKATDVSADKSSKYSRVDLRLRRILDQISELYIEAIVNLSRNLMKEKIKIELYIYI